MLLPLRQIAMVENGALTSFSFMASECLKSHSTAVWFFDNELRGKAQTAGKDAAGMSMGMRRSRGRSTTTKRSIEVEQEIVFEQRAMWKVSDAIALSNDETMH